MESDAQTGNRALVRELLTERLDAAGLTRGRGITASAHKVMQQRLVDHLAYMDRENLMTLAETLIDTAARGIWPSEALVRSMAHALQAPPLAQRRIVSSWLASVEGPTAEAGGWLVELYRFLLATGRPPLAMDMRQIRERAMDNNRQMELVQDRKARGVATDEDGLWMQRYLDDQRAARAVVESGRERRAMAEGAQ